MKLQERLARARKRAGLSQADLAALLKVSTGTVGGWEVGRHAIESARLKQVARVLQVDVEELLP